MDVATCGVHTTINQSDEPKTLKKKMNDSLQVSVIPPVVFSDCGFMSDLSLFKILSRLLNAPGDLCVPVCRFVR